MHLFRREAVRRGFTMLDVDNNPDVDHVPEELISKGDASYESAWIDKLLGNSDVEDEEAGEAAAEARAQSRHNSCHQHIARQDYKQSGIFCFACFFIFLQFSVDGFSQRAHVFQLLLCHLLRVV